MVEAQAAVVVVGDMRNIDQEEMIIRYIKIRVGNPPIFFWRIQIRILSFVFFIVSFSYF